MSGRKILKLTHFAGTIWLVVCLAFILVSVLRQLGVRWWVIFSLTGHSALIIFLLISLYLFLLFQGIKRTTISAEHPLTSSAPYLFLYDISPLLGAFAAAIAMVGTHDKMAELLLSIGLGTMGATFLSWIVIDPTLALIEMLTPASRSHRNQRISQAKELRQKMHKAREELLNNVLLKEKADRQRWQKELISEAKRLAEINSTDRIDFDSQREVARIGLKCWQMGGLSCMQNLHEMAIAECKKIAAGKIIVDHISALWDGIGQWQSPKISEMILVKDKIPTGQQ